MMNASASGYSLAICICTRDRVDVLRRCLQSIADGSQQPDIIFVSDDSADGAAIAAACQEYSNVHYIEGPRRGLCANRNSVLRGVATTHVSLLDDDAVMSENFVEYARELIANCDDKVIITGIVHEANAEIIPRNPSFLGHFGKMPKSRFENVNLNCNLFPSHAFDHASFDEAISYGYEDMDLCSHLLFAGYRIQFEPKLQNSHMPPSRTAAALQARFAQTERERFYTSLKRYLLWRKNYLKLMAYLIVAPAHRALHAIKAGSWSDLRRCVPDMVLALRNALKERARLKQLAVEPSNAHLRFSS